MGLLDGLEKLINEHGSAVILRERIALANDKHAALERELSASKSRVTELESENERLHSELEAANSEIKNLKDLAAPSDKSRLEEIKEKLLQLLSAAPGATIEQVAHGANLNPQLVKFHLNEMQERRFVHASYSLGGRSEWSVAQDGLGYLVRHGLLV